MSQFSSIYLGGQHDPTPTFRDECPAADWPEGAVMAVTFSPNDFPALAEHLRRDLPRTDYFGSDGWPVELRVELKETLPEILKLELQVYPWGWRDYSERSWKRIAAAPGTMRASRIQASIVRAVASLASHSER